MIKKKVLTAATVRTCGNKRKPLLPMYSQLEYSRGSSQEQIKDLNMEDFYGRTKGRIKDDTDVGG